MHAYCSTALCMHNKINCQFFFLLTDIVSRVVVKRAVKSSISKVCHHFVSWTKVSHLHAKRSDFVTIKFYVNIIASVNSGNKG